MTNKTNNKRYSIDLARGADLALHLVSLTYSVPMEELSAPTRRKADVAFARQVAMYLVHVGLGVNLTHVAQAFQRDRSTAAHACRLIEDSRDDEDFDVLVDTLEATLKALHRRKAKISLRLPRKAPAPLSSNTASHLQ